MVREKVKARVAETLGRKKSAAKPAPESPAATTVREDPKTRAKPHGEKVAEAAYYKAQKRDFAPGFDLQDWLEAENELSERASH